MEHTTQDQIHQNQGQNALPRKPFQSILQTISNIFHPLLSLTYAAIAICLFTPLVNYPLQLKLFFICEVAFYTLIMPALIITLLHVFHIIGHWSLRNVRDRTIPFLTNFICYLTNFLVLQRDGLLPDWVLMPYFASVILTFVVWIVSFWWKISAHASGDSAEVALFLILAYYLPDMVPQWLLFGSVIVVGAVCSIRIYLGRHTLAQVGAGALLGVMSMLISSYIYF